MQLRIMYVETKQYLLECRANTSLTWFYQNPFTHDPCVWATTNFMANYNLLFSGQVPCWDSGKKGDSPYPVGPDTLETRVYDPFGQSKSKSSPNTWKTIHLPIKM